MMERKPLVSIILPTYRRTDSLARAIASVKEQSYSNYELIVVDDNGTEEWNEAVRKISAEFGDGLKLITNHPNLGSAKARNAGINAARGQYISFLDDDDIYLPDKLSRQLEAMLEAEADYSITDLELYNERDVLVDRRTRNYIDSYEPEKLLRSHLMHHMTGTDTLMFRADYLRSIGGFPPIDRGDEFYLMMEAIKGGGRFCYVPGCDVKAYVHSGESGGLSSGEGKIQGENELFEYKKQYFDRLEPQSRRYIKMRHHAVLAFAQLRRRNYASAMVEGINSFLASPLALLELILKG